MQECMRHGLETFRLQYSNEIDEDTKNQGRDKGGKNGHRMRIAHHEIHHSVLRLIHLLVSQSS